MWFVNMHVAGCNGKQKLDINLLQTLWAETGFWTLLLICILWIT